MLQKLALFGLLAFSFSSFGQEVILADVMNRMGDEAKTIGMGLRAGKFTDVEVESTKTFKSLIEEATLGMPETATSPELQDKFRSLINELLLKAIALEAAASSVVAQDPQDLSEIGTIFREMLQIQKQGHELFKL